MSKANGGWQTGMFSIDEGPGARGNGMTTLQGSSVKYLIPANGGVYEGKLSADGGSIAGTWTMNGKTLALTLHPRCGRGGMGDSGASTSSEADGGGCGSFV